MGFEKRKGAYGDKEKHKGAYQSSDALKKKKEKRNAKAKVGGALARAKLVVCPRLCCHWRPVTRGCRARACVLPDGPLR
jgi:hypothetical protein